MTATCFCWQRYLLEHREATSLTQRKEKQIVNLEFYSRQKYLPRMKGKSILWKTCRSQTHIFIRQKEKYSRWKYRKIKKVPEMVDMEVNV